MSKIDDLIEYEGLEGVEELMEMCYDSVNPGICMNPECAYTTDVEPDCSDGYCEECGTGTVMSGTMLLMGGF